MNLRPCSSLFGAVFFAALSSLQPGCSGTPSAESAARETMQSFGEVQQAYSAYAQENGRAPSSEQDLIPLLQRAGINPAKLLQSLGGAENVVVFWGVKLTTNSTEPIVLGYQKKSTNGFRLVMTNKGVMKMSDEEFYASLFPPGHQPPR